MTERPPHKVVFLNAPPKAGKDAAAHVAVTSGLGIRHMKFATRLKLMTKQFFELPDDVYTRLETSGNNDMKDVPLVPLHGMSWRQALIWMSEDVVKPKLGQDYFGLALRDTMTKIPSGVNGTIISDSGFVSEAVPVSRRYNPQNCYIIQIYRDSHTFKDDSRSYWSGRDVGIPEQNCLFIHNNHDLSIYRMQVLKKLDSIFGMTNREYTF